MNRKEKALKLYQSGYNCAQSIVGAFEDLLEKRTNTMIDMATGFGGGMGRLQQTCGAVSGAFMVMSSLYNQSEKSSKEQLNHDIQYFARTFNHIHGDLNCKNLIEYNLNDPEEHELAKRNRIFEKKCTQFIETSVELVEDILKSAQEYTHDI